MTLFLAISGISCGATFRYPPVLEGAGLRRHFPSDGTLSSRWCLGSTIIGVVKLALRRPYTFIVMALLIMILGVGSALRTPIDIFPSINIPVVSVVFSYTGCRLTTWPVASSRFTSAR